MGAIGDLGWYTARACVEFLLDPEQKGVDAKLEITSVQVHNVAPPGRTVQRGSAIVTFSNGTTLVSNVGFTGAMEQRLLFFGSKGKVEIQDFILDRYNHGTYNNPDHPPRIDVFQGMNIEPSIRFTIGPLEDGFKKLTPARTKMFERFAKDANDKNAHKYWASRTIMTQKLVDALFYGKV